MSAAPAVTSLNADASNRNDSMTRTSDALNQSSLSLTEVYSDLYTLGPGDGLILTFLDPELKLLGGAVNILPDGTSTLPLIGSVQLSGLTVGQATRWITGLYAKQIVRPELILQLVSQRAVRVTVIGEVTRPGLYELGGGGTAVPGTTNIVAGAAAGAGGGAGGGGGGGRDNIPRVARAIQTAGGVTPNADIRKVLLRRVVGQNGAQKQTFIDLAQVFLVGNQFQNPVLFDGDTIVVGRSSEPIPDEIIRIGRTNLAPATISVSILGEVKNPGTLGLPANTPLIEAIFRAGGLRKWRANKNHIEIIRFNDNGTTTRQVFTYKDDLNVSNAFNPPLRDRDTIIVNRSFYGETLDALNDIAVPLGIINNLGNFGGGGGWGWNNNR